MGKYTRTLFASAAVLFATATAAAAQPASDQGIQFAIPGQPVEAAVLEFGRQAHIQIAVSAAAADHQVTRPVYGKLDPRQALAQMLAGTNLEIVFSDGHMIALDRLKATPETPPAKIRVAEVTRVATQPEAVAARPAASSPSALEEVVVTATRQTSTVNKVALSITAVTQQTLDQQGIKTTADLSRVVPGVGFRTTSDHIASIAIRGVSSNAGARTTGVYIDDVPLQETAIAGGSTTGSGGPLPQIFDLQRVEVLKGPQGTLYGGSAEGGAIRFITPTPSLTTYSGYVRAEGSYTEAGSPSYNGGIAVGGPIVQDKLGFRFSAYYGYIGGYIDDISRLTGQTIAKDGDWGKDQAFRFALRWAPAEHLEITPSVYYYQTHTNDLSTFWENVPSFTVPTKSYQADGKTAATTPANTNYTLPGHTYPAYNFFGPYRSGAVTNVGDNFAGTIPQTPDRSPNGQFLHIYSNTVKYEFPWFTANLITTALANESQGTSSSPYSDTATISGAPFLYNLPVYFNHNIYTDHRTQDIEELRFTSNTDGRLTWTGGLFRSFQRQNSILGTYWAYGDLTQYGRGVNVATYYGVGYLNPATLYGSARDQEVVEDERAIYGEGNYMLTSKLKLTAGIRYSRSQLDYKSYFFGQLLGSFTPTAANGGYTNGAKIEYPITPKIGVSYQFTPTTMAYANAAKGYRVGGLNIPVAYVKCAVDLAALGLTQVPTTYNSDSTWNYEAGLKTRLLGKAQWNSSVFYIDWDKPQLKLALPTCGQNYVDNAGHAVSKGLESSVEWRVFDGFTFSGQVAYTDAYYSQTVSLNTASHPKFVLAGDRLPIPPLAYTLTGQYDFQILDRYSSFVRFDYQYSSNYQQTPGPTTTSFAIDAFYLGEIHDASIRFGVKVNSFDVSLFSNNVLGSKDIVSLSGGRPGCSDAVCTKQSGNTGLLTGTTLRPREVGITGSYHF